MEQKSYVLAMVQVNDSSISNKTSIAFPGFCFMSIKFDINDKNRPDSVQTTWTVLVAINGSAALPTVILNAFIIWAVFGDRHLRYSVFDLLLGLLAVTDLLVGLLVEPLYCSFLGCLLNNCYSRCQFTAFTSLLTLCSGLTMITLAVACVERYLAIEHPNFYRTKITRRTVLVGMIIVWIVAPVCVLSSTAFLNKNHPNLFKIPFMVAAGIFTAIIFYCTSKVHLTARRHRRTIKHQAASIQEPNEQHRREKRQIKEYKRAFTMTVLVVLSVICYIPLIVVVTTEALAGEDVTSDFKLFAVPASVTFVHLQSIINPVMMSLRLSFLRKRLKKRLSHIFLKR